MRALVSLILAVLVTTSSFAAAFETELSQLNKAVRSARTVKEQEAFILQLVALGERAFEADEYAVAVTAFDYASRVARRNRPEEATVYAQRMRAACVARKAHNEIAPHIGKDDATSRRKVAEFRAFVKDDWKDVLHDLAVGDDTIAKAAELDAQHLGGEEAEDVADAWVTAAKAHPSLAQQLYARAGVLYAEAASVEPTAALLRKMAQLGAKIGYDVHPPAGAVRVRGGKHAFTPGTGDGGKQDLKRLFDDSFETGVQVYEGSTAWVGVDFGVPRKITSVVFGPHNTPLADWKVKNCSRQVGATIQVSNQPDFANAITVHTVEKIPAAERLTAVSIDVPGLWRYVRYVAQPGDRFVLGELDVY